jgi:hypothetical protein
MSRLPDPHEQTRLLEAVAAIHGTAAQVTAFIVARYLQDGQAPRLKVMEIAEATGLSRRAAQNALKAAVEAGVLKREVAVYQRQQGDFWLPLFEEETPRDRVPPFGAARRWRALA